MSDFQKDDFQNLPDAFTQDIRDVLEHLYDFPFLQMHPLAEKFAETQRRPNETTGQHLRRLMVEAIEAMNPGTGINFRAPSARLYNLLHLHYIEGMVVKDVSRELGLSLRQAYRDLERGVENVAALLWQKVQPALTDSGIDTPQKPLSNDVERLIPQLESVDLVGLLQYSAQAVNRLAQQQGVEVSVTHNRAEIPCSTDRILARQVLTTLLSRVIQKTTSGTVTVDLSEAVNEVNLTVRFLIQAESSPIMQSSSVLSQLVERLGWQLAEQVGQSTTILLKMKKTSRLLLVIDDNEGLVNLVKRYLENSICQLSASQNPKEGIRLAQELKPDVILLDVMMPEMDGWEVLQRLKANPVTKPIPVIVCSVLNDPGLALSLGAEICLPKPMNPENFLAALRKLNLL